MCIRDRNQGVSYLFAGEERLNCTLLLEKLHRLFGINKLMLAGGGIVNGSFLAENLVDELSIVIAPVSYTHLTMDCCKAVSLAARYDGDIWEDFWAHPGVIDFEPLPLGVVVTVAGTGSECNGGAVITNEERKIKTGRDYPALNPRFALMDPTYTFSVPKKQMASGSFDILSHIMETYFSQPNEDNVSDDIMEALMRSVIRNLRVAMDNPEDYTARSNLMWDSTMAENRLIKMGKKCDFECHNMEHQLGAYTNCNHGCGLAVIHPVYYRHVYKDCLLYTSRCV